MWRLAQDPCKYRQTNSSIKIGAGLDIPFLVDKVELFAILSFWERNDHFSLEKTMSDKLTNHH